MSQFGPSYSGVTIENYLIDNGTHPSNTSVGFSDPWLIDYPDPSYGNVKRNEGMSAPLKPRTSPFSPDYTTSYNGDVYEGVLLNQRYDIPGNPHYSVGFPTGQTITVGGTNHTLNLFGWSASGATIQNTTANQTGVVFTSSNATVTANVKGNLLSSVSSASGYGNQSSIVRDYQGNLEMVYVSAGEIWYTKSTNNGQTWSPEARISAGDGQARNPSIAQWYDNDNHSSSDLNELCVVWVDEYVGQLSQGWSVFSREMQISSGGWDQILPVDNPSSGGNPYASSTSKPAASLVVYQNAQYLTVADEGANTGILIMTENPYGSWYQGALTTNSSDENPDLFTTDYSSLGGFLMYITYDDGNNVYMQYATNPVPSSGTPSFGGVYAVNSGIESSANTSAGITVDGAGTVRFTWRAFDPLYYYQYAIWERSLSWAGWNWSSPVEFAGYSYFDDPSICGHLSNNYGATIMFHDETSTNQIYEVVSNNGGSSWTGGPGNPGLQITTNASYPNLPSTSDPSNVPFAVATTNTTPYVLEPGTRNDVNGTGTLYKASAKEDGLAFSQVIQVVDTVNGFSAAFHLSNLQMNPSGTSGIAAELVQTNHDSSGTGTITFSPSLGQLVSSTGVDLALGGNVTVKKANGSASVALVLADSASNRPFTYLMVGTRVDSTRSEDLPISLNIPHGTLHGNPELAVYVGGQPDTTARLTLVDVYTIEDTAGADSAGKSIASVPLPTDYDLSQNYPNPFNPTTVIDYSIPKAVHVTLKIYDDLGREVKTLVNENESAGYHYVVFEASTLPSGVYFYRISAGKFTSVKKLVLIK